jgi:hypothetical protein
MKYLVYTIRTLNFKRVRRLVRIFGSRDKAEKFVEPRLHPNSEFQYEIVEAP